MPQEYRPRLNTHYDSERIVNHNLVLPRGPKPEQKAPLTLIKYIVDDSTSIVDSIIYNNFEQGIVGGIENIDPSD
jgi:hypothetical protein